MISKCTTGCAMCSPLRLVVCLRRKDRAALGTSSPRKSAIRLGTRGVGGVACSVKQPPRPPPCCARALLVAEKGSHPEHASGIRARAQRQVSRPNLRETRKSPKGGLWRFLVLASGRRRPRRLGRGHGWERQPRGSGLCDSVSPLDARATCPADAPAVGSTCARSPWPPGGTGQVPMGVPCICG